jgi:hypothetical protein
MDRLTTRAPAPPASRRAHLHLAPYTVTPDPPRTECALCLVSHAPAPPASRRVPLHIAPRTIAPDPAHTACAPRPAPCAKHTHPCLVPPAPRYAPSCPRQPSLGGSKLMSTCCNRKFHAFKLYVAYVSSGCCKSRFLCCICFDGYTCVLQVYVSNVSAVFKRMWQVFAYVTVLYMYVACVFSKCFSCFIWILHVFIWMLHMLQWLYTYAASVCSKIFTYFRRMLQVFYPDIVTRCSGYTHMLQTYVSIVSPGFNMLQQVLFPTCSDLRACKRYTHPSSAACPYLFMRANSNSRTCTQRVVSAQMAEHSLVKVHVRIQSARAGQHPTDAEPDFVPHGGAYNGVNTVTRAVLPPSLLHAARRAPHTCSPVQAQEQHARTQEQHARHVKHAVRRSSTRVRGCPDAR